MRRIDLYFKGALCLIHEGSRGRGGGDKGISGKINWEIIAIIEARDDGGLDRVGSKKWPNSGYTLKEEPAICTDGLEWDVRGRIELRMKEIRLEELERPGEDQVLGLKSGDAE